MGLREFFLGYSVNILEIAERSGIATETFLRPDSFIPSDRFITFLELLSFASNRSSLGLELSMDRDAAYRRVGPIALLADFVSTIREWITEAQRCLRYHTNSFSLDILTGTNGEVICRHVRRGFLPPGRQAIEYTFGNIVLLAGAASARNDFRPTLLRFQHRQPDELKFHRLLFNCPIEFECGHDEVVFHESSLDLPARGGLRLLKPLMARFVQSRVDAMAPYDASTTAVAGHAIVGLLGTRRCSVDMVAASLDMSRKRLQQALAKEGTNFSNVLDRCREFRARELLTTTVAPVAEIAGSLDYSDISPFTSAFRRWTGESPLRYRQSHKV